MTRKTWPLLLGCVVVPALLVGACGSGDDDDGDSGDDTSAGGTVTRTSTNTSQNQTRGGSNNATGQLGRGGSNRFTQPSNFGGVLGRGGASAGRGGATGNPFNQGGAVTVTTGKAGSAGMPPNMAGNAGKNATSLAGSSNASGGAPGVGGAPASGGTSPAGGVAGASSSGVQCANGCAAISVPIDDDGAAYYVLDIPQQSITDATQISMTTKVLAPGLASDVRLRLILDDGGVLTNACTSIAEKLTSAAAGFVTVSKQFTCSNLTTSSRAGLRIQNLSGARQTVGLYVESLSVTVGAIVVNWSPAAATIDDAPGAVVLGPAADYAGASISYQAP